MYFSLLLPLLFGNPRGEHEEVETCAPVNTSSLIVYFNKLWHITFLFKEKAPLFIVLWQELRKLQSVFGLLFKDASKLTLPFCLMVSYSLAGCQLLMKNHFILLVIFLHTHTHTLSIRCFIVFHQIWWQRLSSSLTTFLSNKFKGWVEEQMKTVGPDVKYKNIWTHLFSIPSLI